jgi:hypothetical protein
MSARVAIAGMRLAITPRGIDRCDGLVLWLVQGGTALHQQQKRQQQCQNRFPGGETFHKAIV